MANQDSISLVAKQWTLITLNDVTALRAQNMSGYQIRLMGAVGTVPPVSLAGAIVLHPFSILLPDVTLAMLFPGGGAVTRVYAYCDCGSEVSVSHA